MDLTTRPTLDVSHLPDHAWDSKEPLWWGNLLMIFIETTTVVLLLASYYYIRRNYDVFPPPRPEQPFIHDTYPDRVWATVNTLLLVLTCLPMYWTDMQARAQRHGATLAGLVFMFVVSLAATWIRFKEFPGIKFWWGDNAYASIIWCTLGMHLIYIIGAAGEFFVLIAWLLRHKLDEKHGLDVTLCGGYWYWLAAAWIPIYVTVYFAPHFLGT